MENRKLTNYDLFLLKKQEEMRNAELGAKAENPAYEDYLIRELRRTSPSASKVMTEDEFNHSESDVRPVRQKGGTLARVKNASNVKKMGLAFLILYVIIVLALALIVLVHTKSNGVIPGADASAIEEGSIQTMPLDDQEAESENWFDELCDTLNK